MPKTEQFFIEPAPARHFLQHRHQHVLVSNMYQKMYTRRMRKACCRSEQGENGSAGCWPYTRSCYERKRKRDRPENILGASKAELISSKALGKTPLVTTIGRGSQLLASPNSRKMGQDFIQNFYPPAHICPDSLFARHKALFKARTIFPKYPGYFDTCTPDHFSERFRIFRRHFPKYLEYSGKTVEWARLVHEWARLAQVSSCGRGVSSVF